jgi:hypothetical protein
MDVSDSGSGYLEASTASKRGMSRLYNFSLQMAQIAYNIKWRGIAACFSVIFFKPLEASATPSSLCLPLCYVPAKKLLST